METETLESDRSIARTDRCIIRELDSWRERSQGPACARDHAVFHAIPRSVLDNHLLSVRERLFRIGFDGFRPLVSTAY